MWPPQWAAQLHEPPTKGVWPPGEPLCLLSVSCTWYLENTGMKIKATLLSCPLPITAITKKLCRLMQCLKKQCLMHFIHAANAKAAVTAYKEQKCRSTSASIALTSIPARFLLFRDDVQWRCVWLWESQEAFADTAGFSYHTIERISNSRR